VPTGQASRRSRRRRSSSSARSVATGCPRRRTPSPLIPRSAR